MFTTPNEIGEAAWKNWVQERGLYFLGETRTRATTTSCSSRINFRYNQGPKTGALVEAQYGKGRWVYVGLGLWRQLPAGTDGAYQLLANLISLGKAPRVELRLPIADCRLESTINLQSICNLQSAICDSDYMEVPLTPLEFARRTRALYPDREAVVDGALRLTYAQFFDRCDRWSAALQALGVKPGDRVAYIAPNTHAQLESFYAVPQIGAVLVPINYRLSAGRVRLHHQPLRRDASSARTRTTSSAVDGIRSQLPGVRHFVALEGVRDAPRRGLGDRGGWLDYEALLGEAPPEFERPAIDENDLLTINYTSGTTSRPKGVMITHRNA